jgi:PAS domain S-box-containing protein
MWETILSGSHWRGEIKNRAKDGTHYWVDTVITPVLNENREITQFLSVRNIITIQKEQEEILRANEEKFRDLIENTSDLIQSVDGKGQVVFVNESWKKRLGYTDEEVIGKNIFNFIHPANRSHCEAIFERIKNGEEVRSVEVLFCLQMVTGFCEIISMPFDNFQWCCQGIFRDVTEARKYQQCCEERPS